MLLPQVSHNPSVARTVPREQPKVKGCAQGQSGDSLRLASSH